MKKASYAVLTILEMLNNQNIEDDDHNSDVDEYDDAIPKPEN